MPVFSLGTVWEETIAFMRRESALLVPLALALFGPAQIMLEYGMTAARAARTGGPVSPLLMLLVIPGAVLALFGNVATSFIALAPGISVAEALSRGLRRLPMAIATTLLLGFGMAGAALVVMIAAVVGAMAFRIDPRTSVVASQIGAVVVIPMMVLMIRMLLMVPVLAMERIGPVDTLRRAWALGSGNALRFIGVWLLVMFLGFLVALLEQFVVGTLILLLRQAVGSSELLAILQLLINAGLEALLSVGLAVYIAFVYRKLATPVAGP